MFNRPRGMHSEGGIKQQVGNHHANIAMGCCWWCVGSSRLLPTLPSLTVHPINTLDCFHSHARHTHLVFHHPATSTNAIHYFVIILTSKWCVRQTRCRRRTGDLKWQCTTVLRIQSRTAMSLPPSRTLDVDTFCSAESRYRASGRRRCIWRTH
jgi:hypothetical protein